MCRTMRVYDQAVFDIKEYLQDIENLNFRKHM